MRLSVWYRRNNVTVLVLTFSAMISAFLFSVVNRDYMFYTVDYGRGPVVELMSAPYPLELVLPLYLFCEATRQHRKSRTEHLYAIRNSRFLFPAREVAAGFVSGLAFSLILHLLVLPIKGITLQELTYSALFLSVLIKGLYLSFVSFVLQILVSFRVSAVAAAGIIFILAAIDYILTAYSGMGNKGILFCRAFGELRVVPNLIVVGIWTLAAAVLMIYTTQYVREYME